MRRCQSRIGLPQGALDLLVSQTLEWGPQHGHSDSQAIRIDAGEEPRVDTDSLYPALHRLAGILHSIGGTGA
jgi:DNA-binding PadR family transcriptional regulator